MFKKAWFRSFVFGLFFIEVVIVLFSVDILPLIVTCGCCVLGLIINYFRKYRYDDTIEYEGDLEVEGNIVGNVFCVLVLVFSLLILVGLIFEGREVLSTSLLEALNISKLSRFSLYGITYPFLFAYFVTWMCTDIRPIVPEHIKFFCILLLIALFIGLLICIHWESYSNIMVKL